ncbi:MAG: basic amino acid/polyamine antiporter, family [Solirubrobacteraceae bacterium]|nr:basic amino acid/polyamine antiporter, family [Solirubrobacteraceae bacterium]
MATATTSDLFATKDLDTVVEEADSSGLKRQIGALDLTALGIGGIIGTGIYVIIGEAIGESGPAILISFLLAGVTCFFSALSYSELASSIPVSGSAYTYSYATMGELMAWIIGWDLLLEYGLSIGAIAVGWGAYLKEFLESVFSISIPDAIALPPGEGGSVNVCAVIVVVGVALLLISGVRESTRANTIMVGVKIVVLIFFCIVAATAFDIHHFDNFAPHGLGGIRSAGAIIFFAYIGFDAVSTGAGEAKNPGRDLPIGIIGSLLISTVIYLLVAVFAIGALSAAQLSGPEADAPLAGALRVGADVGWAADVLSFGALIAITSVVLTFLYGQTRITVSMGRDGLIPPVFKKVHAKRGTPILATIIFAGLGSVLAAFVSLSELSKLVNIGTLFAFLLVNIGVIILRRTKPDMNRNFRVPFVPVFPLIGAALCIYLMTTLDGQTWIRFVVWLVLGFVVYFGYGRQNSVLRRTNAAR